MATVVLKCRCCIGPEDRDCCRASATTAHSNSHGRLSSRCRRSHAWRAFIFVRFLLATFYSVLSCHWRTDNLAPPPISPCKLHCATHTSVTVTFPRVCSKPFNIRHTPAQAMCWWRTKQRWKSPLSTRGEGGARGVGGRVSVYPV